jgi:MFS family permease
MEKIEGKLNVKQTVLLSFGFFGSSLVWSVYNTYVPLLLNDLVSSAMVIGLIMSIDNFFGVIFQPIFGRISDKTRTRFGRRLPFLFACMPVCAVLFIILPHARFSLLAFMPVAILFTFAMSIWRTPAVSLMPDLTPGPFRSQANGIVNLIGGVGAVLAFLGGGIIFDMGGYPLPFLISALLLLAALLVLVFFVREPAYPPLTLEEKTLAKKEKIVLSKPERKSLIFILSAIFFWFMGYDTVQTFFSLYATTTLGVTPGQASIMLAFFAAALILFAIPAGFIGGKFGRRKTILTGLTGITVLFLPLVFIANPWLTRALLFAGGMFWACVNINSLPMIVRIAGPQRIGAFIGYYYLFSYSAQVINTPLYGFIYDRVGNYQSLFVYACITFFIAALCLMFVRHGEEEPKAMAAAVSTT